MPGTLALVGGEEFTDGCSFDEELVADATSVLVVPTARAYENPAVVIEGARSWFDRLGASVDALEVYRRSDASDESLRARVEAASVIYVTGGSPMHLRSVLKDSPLLDWLVQAWNDGATVALAGESAAAACTNMIDSRGGALTVGLDVISSFTVVPRLNQWSPEMWHRTIELTDAELPIVGIDEATAAIRSPEGGWRSAGVGSAHVYVGGHAAELSVLP